MSTPIPNAEAVTAIAELAKAGVQRHQFVDELYQKPAVIWPDKTITPLEHLLDRPVSKRGNAKVGDAFAFSTYVNAHRTPGLVIFGEVDEASGYFCAILDGHVPCKLKPREGDQDAPIEVIDDGQPGWAEHKVELALKPTPEWARWIGKSGKLMPQEEFAIFLEENAADVIVPEGVTQVAGYPVPANLPNAAQLTSVALTLQTKVDVKFSSSINRQNGQQQVSFIEQVTGSHGAEGTIGIPENFAIAVAPFRGSAPQVVLARLRYRAAGGKASFVFEIIRPHKIVEHAWKLVAKDISAATGEDVLLGRIQLAERS